jgi:hypothetical protein
MPENQFKNQGPMRLLLVLEVIAIAQIMGACGNRFSNPKPPTVASAPSCYIQIATPVIMTNPITQNPDPTLDAKVFGFSKRDQLTYSWTIANPGAGGTLRGSGKSAAFSMSSMADNATVDVILNVATSRGQSATCDVQITKQPGH